MLIDSSYIVQSMERLVKEKQQAGSARKAEDDKLYLVKQRFPKWLRKMVFHPFNPAYSVFLQNKAWKSKKEHVVLDSLHPLAVDFVRYCLTNDIKFDTSLYYPKEDESTLTSFVDNRLKSVISGYGQLPANEQQKEMAEKKKALQRCVKKSDKGYMLSLEGNDYYLPSDSFNEHTYIHEYGLKYLPEYIKEYIAGKDFLDVGAYLGDTSILLLKKYNPSHLFAYEPVKQNADQLRETVMQNNTDKITVVEKGLGDKEEEIDIYINPQESSSCSTNNSLVSNHMEKARIQITTIDKECRDRTVSLIKMDIEGAEYSAIKGALETIKRDKPVLLISLYHTGKDFFEIPPLLKEAVPEYEFRFLNIEITNPISEKILVAYPRIDK